MAGDGTINGGSPMFPAPTLDEHERAWATDPIRDQPDVPITTHVTIYADQERTVPDGQETRVTDPTTGGAKGSKLAAFHLIPWGIIRELAEHFGRGARKYEDRNWERGYAWSLSFAALHRHLESFWSGDEIDHDPSLYVEGETHTARHIIAVVWHACVLAYFSARGAGTDDRPIARPPASLEEAKAELRKALDAH